MCDCGAGCPRLGLHDRREVQLVRVRRPRRELREGERPGDLPLVRAVGVREPQDHVRPPRRATYVKRCPSGENFALHSPLSGVSVSRRTFEPSASMTYRSFFAWPSRRELNTMRLWSGDHAGLPSKVVPCVSCVVSPDAGSIV